MANGQACTGPDKAQRRHANQAHPTAAALAGIIYGLSGYGLAQQMDISVGAAQVNEGWLGCTAWCAP